MHKRRKRVNTVALALAFGAMAFGVFWLIWILFETIRLGGGGLNFALFTESTPAAMSDGGGLANAIYGSVVMVAGGHADRHADRHLLGRLPGRVRRRRAGSASTTRFINDVLLSAPSIVIGLFIYELVVVPARRRLRLGRLDRAGADRHPGRHPHHREHAQPRAARAARGRLRARHAQVEGDLDGHADAPRARASSPACCWPSPASPARRRRCCTPRCRTSSSTRTWPSRWPACRWSSSTSPTRPYPNLQRIAWAGVFLITLGVLGLNIAARVFFRNKN